MVSESKNKNILLASGSPRRKELLKLLGLEFEIQSLDTDETIPANQSPREAVEEIAKRKSFAAYSKLSDPSQFIVIGADTIVVSSDKILGKPSSSDNAFEMLKQLSGQKHYVLTGVSISISHKNKHEYISGVEESEVTFRTIRDEEIKAYIATKEPMDKAGAYALQGLGSAFVERINGCYSNIIGLPIPLTVSMLRQAGVRILDCT